MLKIIYTFKKFLSIILLMAVVLGTINFQTLGRYIVSDSELYNSSIEEEIRREEKIRNEEEKIEDLKERKKGVSIISLKKVDNINWKFYDNTHGYFSSELSAFYLKKVEIYKNKDDKLLYSKEFTQENLQRYDLKDIKLNGVNNSDEIKVILYDTNNTNQEFIFSLFNLPENKKTIFSDLKFISLNKTKEHKERIIKVLGKISDENGIKRITISDESGYIRFSQGIESSTGLSLSKINFLLPNDTIFHLGSKINFLSKIKLEVIDSFGNKEVSKPFEEIELYGNEETSSEVTFLDTSFNYTDTYGFLNGTISVGGENSFNEILILNNSDNNYKIGHIQIENSVKSYTFKNLLLNSVKNGDDIIIHLIGDSILSKIITLNGIEITDSEFIADYKWFYNDDNHDDWGLLKTDLLNIKDLPKLEEIIIIKNGEKIGNFSTGTYTILNYLGNEEEIDLIGIYNDETKVMEKQTITLNGKQIKEGYIDERYWAKSTTRDYGFFRGEGNVGEMSELLIYEIDLEAPLYHEKGINLELDNIKLNTPSDEGVFFMFGEGGNELSVFKGNFWGETEDYSSIIESGEYHNSIGYKTNSIGFVSFDIDNYVEAIGLYKDTGSYIPLYKEEFIKSSSTTFPININKHFSGIDFSQTNSGELDLYIFNGNEVRHYTISNINTVEERGIEQFESRYEYGDIFSYGLLPFTWGPPYKNNKPVKELKTYISQKLLHSSNDILYYVNGSYSQYASVSASLGDKMEIGNSIYVHLFPREGEVIIYTGSITTGYELNSYSKNGEVYINGKFAFDRNRSDERGIVIYNTDIINPNALAVVKYNTDILDLNPSLNTDPYILLYSDDDVSDNIENIGGVDYYILDDLNLGYDTVIGDILSISMYNEDESMYLAKLDGKGAPLNKPTEFNNISIYYNSGSSEKVSSSKIIFSRDGEIEPKTLNSKTFSGEIKANIIFNGEIVDKNGIKEINILNEKKEIIFTYNVIDSLSSESLIPSLYLSDIPKKKKEFNLGDLTLKLPTKISLFHLDSKEINTKISLGDKLSFSVIDSLGNQTESDFKIITQTSWFSGDKKGDYIWAGFSAGNITGIINYNHPDPKDFLFSRVTIQDSNTEKILYSRDFPNRLGAYYNSVQINSPINGEIYIKKELFLTMGGTDILSQNNVIIPNRDRPYMNQHYTFTPQSFEFTVGDDTYECANKRESCSKISSVNVYKEGKHIYYETPSKRPYKFSGKASNLILRGGDSIKINTVYDFSNYHTTAFSSNYYKGVGEASENIFLTVPYTIPSFGDLHAYHFSNGTVKVYGNIRDDDGIKKIEILNTSGNVLTSNSNIGGLKNIHLGVINFPPMNPQPKIWEALKVRLTDTNDQQVDSYYTGIKLFKHINEIYGAGRNDFLWLGFTINNIHSDTDIKKNIISIKDTETNKPLYLREFSLGSPALFSKGIDEYNFFTQIQQGPSENINGTPVSKSVSISKISMGSTGIINTYNLGPLNFLINDREYQEEKYHFHRDGRFNFSVGINGNTIPLKKVSVYRGESEENIFEQSFTNIDNSTIIRTNLEIDNGVLIAGDNLKMIVQYKSNSINSVTNEHDFINETIYLTVPDLDSGTDFLNLHIDISEDGEERIEGSINDYDGIKKIEILNGSGTIISSYVPDGLEIETEVELGDIDFTLNPKPNLGDKLRVRVTDIYDNKTTSDAIIVLGANIALKSQVSTNTDTDYKNTIGYINDGSIYTSYEAGFSSSGKYVLFDLLNDYNIGKMAIYNGIISGRPPSSSLLLGTKIQFLDKDYGLVEEKIIDSIGPFVEKVAFLSIHMKDIYPYTSTETKIRYIKLIFTKSGTNYPRNNSLNIIIPEIEIYPFNHPDNIKIIPNVNLGHIDLANDIYSTIDTNITEYQYQDNLSLINDGKIPDEIDSLWYNPLQTEGKTLKFTLPEKSKVGLVRIYNAYINEIVAGRIKGTKVQLLDGNNNEISSQTINSEGKVIDLSFSSSLSQASSVQFSFSLSDSNMQNLKEIEIYGYETDSFKIENRKKTITPIKYDLRLRKVVEDEIEENLPLSHTNLALLADVSTTVTSYNKYDPTKISRNGVIGDRENPPFYDPVNSNGKYLKFNLNNYKHIGRIRIYDELLSGSISKPNSGVLDIEVELLGENQGNTGVLLYSDSSWEETSTGVFDLYFPYSIRKKTKNIKLNFNGTNNPRFKKIEILFYDVSDEKKLGHHHWSYHEDYGFFTAGIVKTKNNLKSISITGTGLIGFSKIFDDSDGRKSFDIRDIKLKNEISSPENNGSSQKVLIVVEDIEGNIAKFEYILKGLNLDIDGQTNSIIDIGYYTDMGYGYIKALIVEQNGIEKIELAREDSMDRPFYSYDANGSLLYNLSINESRDITSTGGEIVLSIVDAAGNDEIYYLKPVNTTYYKETAFLSPLWNNNRNNTKSFYSSIRDDDGIKSIEIFKNKNFSNSVYSKIFGSGGEFDTGSSSTIPIYPTFHFIQTPGLNFVGGDASTVLITDSIGNKKTYQVAFDVLNFMSKWKIQSSNEQITLPLEQSGNYNFTINWGDGSTDLITSYNQSEVTHTYTNSGEYTVTIDGTINGFNFNSNSSSKDKIIDISQWGNLRLGNNGGYFRNATNLQITAYDSPDLSQTTNLSKMFEGATSFNSNIGNWDVSSVDSTASMFYNTINFNQPLNNWNVSGVNSMDYMFYNARNFNQNISNWDVSNVTSHVNYDGSAVSWSSDYKPHFSQSCHGRLCYIPGLPSL